MQRIELVKPLCLAMLEYRQRDKTCGAESAGAEWAKHRRFHARLSADRRCGV